MINIKDILVLIILFAANLLQAITGFAGTLISMPPVLKLIGAGEAKALLNAIAQISSLMIVCTGFKYINWKEFFRIFGCMVCGMVVGIWIYNRFPLNQLLIFYGVMIMIIALKKMFIKEKRKNNSYMGRNINTSCSRNNSWNVCIRWCIACHICRRCIKG